MYCKQSTARSVRLSFDLPDVLVAVQIYFANVETGSAVQRVGRFAGWVGLKLERFHAEFFCAFDDGVDQRAPSALSAS